MSLGPQHDRASHKFGRSLMAIAAGLVIFGGFSWFRLCLSLALFAGYWFGAFWLLPDLDLWSVCKSRWGPLAFIWRSYSRDYRHRGSSVWEWGPSHWPLVGTLTRLLELSTWIASCSFLLAIAYALGAKDPMNRISQLFEHFSHWLTIGWPFFLAAIAGIELAALCHLWMDFTDSLSKARR